MLILFSIKEIVYHLSTFLTLIDHHGIQSFLARHICELIITWAVVVDKTAETLTALPNVSINRPSARQSTRRLNCLLNISSWSIYFVRYESPPIIQTRFSFINLL